MREKIHSLKSKVVALPSLPTLPREILDRVINFLPSDSIGMLRGVNSNLHASEFITHAIVRTEEAIKKNFPLLTSEQIAEIRPLIETVALAESPHNNANLFFHPKLWEQLMHLQNQELEPLRQEIARWIAVSQNPAEKKIVKLLAKRLNELDKDGHLTKIFLWAKTGNEQQLLNLKLEWSELLWLLHARDVNGLSLFDWAIRSNLSLFLTKTFNKPLHYVHLISETDPLAAISSPLDTLYNTTNLQWAIICQKKPEEFFHSQKEKVIKMALGRVNTFRENAFHHAVRNIELTWLQHLLPLIVHEPTLRENLFAQKNKAGHTPLLVAAHIGNWPAVALLLEHGASPKHLLSLLITAPDTLPQSPRMLSRLHIVVQYLTHIQLLTFIKSSPNITLNEPSPTGKTALHFACQKGELNSVLFLLSQGAYLTQTDDRSWSALHFAISSHNINLINHLKICLQQTGKYVLPTIKGRSVAHIAALEGNGRVIDLFIEDIINLQIHDEDGHTPLSLAIIQGKHESVLHILQKMHPSIILPNHYLHLAAQAGFPHMDKLISRITDINQIDTNGDTALHQAIQHNHVFTAYHLLKAGAAIDIKNTRQQSPKSHVLKYKNPILMCLFELKVYEFNPIHWYAKKPSATKSAAIKALQEVIFNNADPTILIPHQTVLTPDGSKSIYKFYRTLLPLINPSSQPKHSEAQATSSHVSN